MEKPEVDFIEGLSPAIAIEQRSAGTNPRSIIATTTEIYDYLRVLFPPSASRMILSPVSQFSGRRRNRSSIRSWPTRRRQRLFCSRPWCAMRVGEFRDVIDKSRREGFVRIRVDGEIVELARPEPIRLKRGERHTIEAVVDRLVIREGLRSRLADSLETALKWGSNRVVVLRERTQKAFNVARSTSNVSVSDEWEEVRYSTDYGNPETNFSLGQLTPKHFSFNSHLGACPACHGLGTQLVCDPELMVTDPTKSLAEGAVVPWRRGTKRMQSYYRGLQTALVRHFDVADDIPFADLPERIQVGALLRNRRSANRDEVWRQRPIERENGAAL